jgi:hypothetical protein
MGKQAPPVQLVKNGNREYACLRKGSATPDFDQCVGGVPCVSCQKAETKCEVNTDNDGRRRTKYHRKIESLEQDRDLLLQLVETIRKDDTQTAPGILSLIRNNGTLEEIRQYLAQSLTSGDSDGFPRESQQNRSKFMDINRLSDTPIFEAPANPWTSTTDDDDFVSHLISLYFTWQHCISNYIDRDLFLRDMRSKELSSHFCSPLLVNSILAVACVSLYLDFLKYRQLTRLLMHSFTRITMKLLLYRMKLVPAVNIFLKRQFVCFEKKTEDYLLPLYKREGIFILGRYRPNLFMLAYTGN